jgi:acetyl esterase
VSPRVTVERRLARLLLALPPRVQLALAGGRPVRGDDGTLDPGLQLLLAVRSKQGTNGLLAPTVEAARAQMSHGRSLLTGAPTPVRSLRDLTVDGATGPLTARHYVPSDEPGAPLLVYLHGGGFVLGDLESHDEACRVLARHAGTQVLAVDYRLAPEHPFPAAVEDAAAAFAWAREHAQELGADPDRVAIGGDSAGGNLAAVVAQQTRGGDDAPAAQVLIYPLTDVSRRHPSRDLFARDLLLTDDDIVWFEQHYAPGTDPTDLRRSPLLAPDLSGLAPAVVVTAAFDPLRDEGEAYARALREAGVPVVSWRAPGLVHGFLSFSSVHRPSRDAVLRLAGSVHAVLHGQPAAARG